MNDESPQEQPATPKAQRPQFVTKRERDMVQGVIDGKTNKQIAFTYGLRENTVKVYMSLLFDKLGVDDRFALGNWGRAFAEGEKRVNDRYLEIQREMNPGLNMTADQVPTFQNTKIAEFDVFRAMARQIKMTASQASEIFLLLSADGRHSSEGA